MGYYTTYRLEIKDEEGVSIFDSDEFDTSEADRIAKAKAQYPDLIKEDIQPPSMGIGSALIDAIGYNPFSESCKWYEWEEDMRKFSDAHPEKLFALEGDGEEVGDKWVAYFLAGRMQKHKMPEWIAPPVNRQGEWE